MMTTIQAPKKWNTKHGNGTKNASLVVFARTPSERSHLFRANRKSTVLAAMKRNMPLDALNVIK